MFTYFHVSLNVVQSNTEESQNTKRGITFRKSIVYYQVLNKQNIIFVV